MSDLEEALDWCPICNLRERDPSTRNSPTGHWCMPCQDEFDSIDWDAIYDERGH